MFEKNDEQLLIVRILVNVGTWIGAIGGVIIGIVFSATGLLEVGLPILFGLPILSWVMWMYARLRLCYLCDIKLIRNKLYGVDNDNLKVFLEEKLSEEEIEELKRVEMQNTEKLIKLKSLRDSGVITEEEFQQEKEKILK